MPNVPTGFVEYIHTLRSAELETIFHFIPEGARVLEVGGGTGYQAQLLTERGVSIVSVDVKESIWRDSRVFDIIEYDGGILPFPDNSFDIVLSSHVLCQIPNLAASYREMARILRAGGSAIHVLPTHWWRIWAYISSYPHLVKQSIVWCSKGSGAVRNLSADSWTPSRILRRLLGPPRTGVRGNAITEVYFFHPAWWRRHFRQHGWTIVEECPLKIFSTGNAVGDPFLGIRARRRLARLLGSTTHLFRVAPADGDDTLSLG